MTAEMYELVREGTRKARELRAHFNSDPAKGSAARWETTAAAAGQAGAKDNLSDWRNAVEKAYLSANLLIPCNEELLDAMCSLMSEGNQAPAVASARVSLEYSARIWRQYEPNIGPKKRVSRGLTEYIYGLHEQRRCFQVIQAESQVERCQDAIERDRQLATRLGFDVRKDQYGRPYLVDDRPKSGELITQVLAYPSGTADRLGVFVWRLLSAFSHGTLYSVMQVYAPSEHPITSKEGAMLADVPEFALSTLRVAFLAFLNSYGCVARVCGWDALWWEQWAAGARLKTLASIEEATATLSNSWGWMTSGS